MVDVTFWVYRSKTEDFADLEGRKKFAQQRARIIHSLADTLEFEVKDWGLTEQMDPPKEVVAIILALGSAGVFTALVKALKIYSESRKIGEAKMTLPDGRQLAVTSVTLKDLSAVAKMFGFAPEPPRRREAFNEIP